MTLPAGPLLHATLIVDDLAPLLAAYAALGLQAGAVTPLPAAQAAAWGQPALGGLPSVLLAAPGAAPLLRLLQRPGTPPRATRTQHGWLALEVLVREVDALQAPARAAGFEIVGPPADLELSPAIRAMQLVGPAGEMLYLTQVKAPVPPFDLPLSADLPASQSLGPLFIGVMSVPSRQAAIDACAMLAPRQVLQFETRVSVLNRAFDLPLATRWPLATVALARQSLFEIDEVAAAAPPLRLDAGGMPAGLAWVSVAAPDAMAGDGRLVELAPGVWLETVQAVPAG
jgi:hypothetical protein